MPVYKSIEINSNNKAVIWQITESEDELFSYLSPKEMLIEDLKKISAPKKRLEFLAVRCLLKQIKINPNDLQKTANGAPRIRGVELHLSVSHSYPFVVIITSKTNKVGIDIEKIRPTVARVAQKFLSQAEAELVKGDLEKTTTVWGAKEVAFKIYEKGQVIYSDHIRILNKNSFPDHFFIDFLKPNEELKIEANAFTFDNHRVVCGQLI